MEHETTIRQLAELLNKNNLSHDFMQIMYVYTKEKPGYFVQTNDRKELEMVAPYIHSLGLFISFKHEGYITNNKHKYKSWESPWFYIKKNHLGTFYLGYPRCCEIAFKKTGPFSSAHLYYIIKQIVADKNTHAYNILRQYIEDMMFLEEYAPCTINCEESHKRAEKFKKVFHEFKALLPQNYLHKRRQEIVQILIKDLEFIKNNPYGLEHFKKHVFPKIKKHHYKHIFRLEDGFYKEIEAVMNNPLSADKIIEEGKRLIR